MTLLTIVIVALILSSLAVKQLRKNSGLVFRMSMLPMYTVIRLTLTALRCLSRRVSPSPALILLAFEISIGLC